MIKFYMRIAIALIASLFFSSSLLFGGEEYLIVTEPLDPLSYKENNNIIGISTEIGCSPAITLIIN